MRCQLQRALTSWPHRPAVDVAKDDSVAAEGGDCSSPLVKATSTDRVGIASSIPTSDAESMPASVYRHDLCPKGK